MKINVLRLDHRIGRDARITTHVCLTSRAFGASKVFLSGEEDKHLTESVRNVVERWGGDFEVEYRKNWEKLLEEWKNSGKEVVHLTMYGEPVQEVTKRIRESPKDKIVVVGGAKVPTEVYKAADWNVSVTTQPHSEVAALAIFLHTLFEGGEYDLNFKGEKLKVLPTAHGKRVLTKNKQEDLE